MPANGAYSPLSLYYALALANEGAAGTTADQITSALGAPADVDVAGQCGSLFRALVANPDSKVALANSVWLGKDVPFEQDFVNSAVGQFYATPFSLSSALRAADDALAAWISENTDGLVNPAIETDASQILAIVNAIAFKGSWLSPFDEAATQEDVFHAEGGDVQGRFHDAAFERPSGGSSHRRLSACEPRVWRRGVHDVRPACRGDVACRPAGRSCRARRGVLRTGRRSGLRHLHSAQGRLRQLARPHSGS